MRMPVARAGVVGALGVLLLGARALGQTPAGASEPKPSDCLKEEKSIRPQDVPGNAAIEYFKVWDSLPAAEFELVTHFGNVAFAQNDPIKLSPPQRDLCLKHQEFIEGLMRCAAMDTCDWGAQRALGEEMRLPHLRFLRFSYRALLMDFYRCLEDRSAQGAAMRLAAIIRMVRHTRTDGTWFSSLVTSGHAQGVVEHTGEFLKSGIATPATAKLLLDAFTGVRKANPFEWKEAFEWELWNRTQWPRTICAGDAAGAKYIEVQGGPDSFWPKTPAPWFIEGFGQQRLYSDLDRYKGYLEKTVPLWSDPANEVTLREGLVEAMEGQFGAVACVQAHGLELMRSNLMRARRQMSQVETDLVTFIKKAELQP
jgi:hypothetical protein